MKTRAICAFLALSAALMSAACGVGDSAPEQSTDGSVRKVRVGVPANANGISAYIAARDFADDYGLQVEAVTIKSGAEAVPMLMNGQLDISLGDALGTLMASSNGVPVVVAGVASVASPDPTLDPSAIFVSGPDTGVTQLEGQTLAVSALGGAPELIARAGIDAAGGSSEQVNFVELNPAQMANSISSGRVKAGLAIEPFTTAASEAGLTEVLRPMATGYAELPVTVWFTSQKFAQTHRDTVESFLGAVQSAGVEANGDLPRARKTAGEFIEMDPRVLDAIRLPVFAENVTDVDSVEELVQLADRYDLFDKKPDLGGLLGQKFEAAAP
ncbi:MAG: ABC transporter substrate-binding protein [Hyphomicrobiales bacterium]|nr:MAG: ABC transporter substrate-binding protein [Hyphomicrobiales bacterium]